MGPCIRLVLSNIIPPYALATGANGYNIDFVRRPVNGIKLRIIYAKHVENDLFYLIANCYLTVMPRS